MITYNQEKYVAQAIDSVLMQKTKYRMQLIIGDDHSTDNTVAIIKNYAEKYPDVIKPKYNEKNLGPMTNFIDTLHRCEDGEYVAMLEGDDYWSSPEKIEQQVFFLEQNKNYSASTHDVQILYANETKFKIKKYLPQKESISLLDVLKVSKFRIDETCSFVFRSSVIRNLPQWFSAYPVGDTPLHLLIASRGDIRRMSAVMGVYRRHGHGLSIVEKDFVEQLNYYQKKMRALRMMRFVFGVENAIYIYKEMWQCCREKELFLLGEPVKNSRFSQFLENLFLRVIIYSELIVALDFFSFYTKKYGT